jgi:hypothetical protein
MNALMNLLLVVFLIVPLIYQLILGIKATHPSSSFKFWKVCMISLLGLVLTTVLNVFLMTERLKLAGSRDGLPIITILILEALIGAVLVLMVLIQLFLRRRRKLTHR